MLMTFCNWTLRSTHEPPYFRICCGQMLAVALLATFATPVANADDGTIAAVFARVRRHEFHPLNSEGAFTNDRTLGVHGIADLEDGDWKVRLVAISELARLLPDNGDAVIERLIDENLHVRQIAAAALGNARQKTAAPKLEEVLKKDASPVVRSQAAISLGQMESRGALDVLKKAFKEDSSRDVRHQCELAIDRIEKKLGVTEDQLTALRNLNPKDFETVRTGDKVPDFVLKDTVGAAWRLSDANKGTWVVLIWIFADWCPVCHGEFRDLIELRKEFKDVGIAVATIECHDNYRSRVMVGKELAPQYWFAKKSFKDTYTAGIWWPHLVDHGGAVGAKYGVDPMCFAVHSEYVNRPATVIIDPQGVVRFAYYGTFWGDRPSVRQTLEMLKTKRFEFEHRDRRKMPPPVSNK